MTQSSQNTNMSENKANEYYPGEINMSTKQANQIHVSFNQVSYKLFSKQGGIYLSRKTGEIILSKPGNLSRKLTMLTLGVGLNSS